MKATELVEEYLATCANALDIATHKLDIAEMKFLPKKGVRKIELEGLRRVKCISAGKVEAAQEILAALKEIEQ